MPHSQKKQLTSLCIFIYWSPSHQLISWCQLLSGAASWCQLQLGYWSKWALSCLYTAELLAKMIIYSRVGCFCWECTAFNLWDCDCLQNFPAPWYACSSFTGLHIQKAHTNLGTSSMQILLLSAHACMHFAWELQLEFMLHMHSKHRHWLQINSPMSTLTSVRLLDMDASGFISRYVSFQFLFVNLPSMYIK